MASLTNARRGGGRNVNVSALTEVYATCTITLCTDTGIDTGGNKRHIQWRRESVFGIARCCVRIVGHCHVVRRTERDRRARIVSPGRYTVGKMLYEVMAQIE